MNKTLPLTAMIAALTSAPALAETQPSSVAVTYADLDLATPGGRRTLDQRLRQAVSTACAASPTDLRGMNAAPGCRAALHARLAPHRAAILAEERRTSPILADRR